MEIRGERECTECGTRWSYYETGSVNCPQCGSIHSVGTDEERKHHTATPTSLDLTPHRAEVDARPLREIAADAAEDCRDYLRQSGFVHADELCELDETYLAAAELRHVADIAERAMRLDDREERYLLELLERADSGERPDSDDVPRSMRAARGLAAVDAIETYRREIRTLFDEPEPAVRSVLESLDERTRRIESLEGDVEPTTADGLVAAARELGRYLRDGDESALVRAESRLERVE